MLLNGWGRGVGQYEYFLGRGEGGPLVGIICFSLNNGERWSAAPLREEKKKLSKYTGTTVRR